ncbi:MAG: VanZ family protein, partial [Burkholderiales bacterium]|nr:VanZ family protein [Burkholderiales bacterium]
MAALLSALIVYASLYPFDGWRLSGQPPWAFLTAPLPRYWTWFDVLSNWLGYVPLGFLCVLVALRSGASRLGWWLLVLYPSLLSLLMETVQGYLSARVSSNV